MANSDDAPDTLTLLTSKELENLQSDEDPLHKWYRRMAILGALAADLMASDSELERILGMIAQGALQGLQTLKPPETKTS